MYADSESVLGRASTSKLVLASPEEIVVRHYILHS
jgi:hypothetical protein